MASPVRPLVLIPARVGSKGVPSKNFKALPNGESLLTMAIAVGQDMGAVVVVSTDHPKYREDFTYRDKHVVAVERPKLLAGDDVPMAAVVKHALGVVPGHPDQVIMLLQPTTPFRDPRYLRACRYSAAKGFPTATVSRIPSKYKRARPINGELLIELPDRRQMGDERFIFTGECYAFRRDKGWPMLGLWRAVMTPERLNIDTHDDLATLCSHLHELDAWDALRGKQRAIYEGGNAAAAGTGR
jgi:hypothetical protein